MKILITGVTSFIGRALARELIAEGIEVCGMVRPASVHKEDLPDKLEIIECDLEQCEQLESRGLSNIYACIHLGWDGIGQKGRMDPEIQKENINNSLCLITVLGRLGCKRFVFAGSQAEYGIVTKRITEETECHPVSEYGKAKLKMLSLASECCAGNEMTYIHARIFSVYGPGDHETSLVSSCLKAFAEDRHIDLGPCRQMWNYLYVSDCAKALADLATCVFTVPEERTETDAVVNVGAKQSAPLRQYVERIRNCIGSGSYAFTERPESPEGTPVLEPDTEKLCSITGFRETVEFEEGIRKIEELYRMR